MRPDVELGLLGCGWGDPAAALTSRFIWSSSRPPHRRAVSSKACEGAVEENVAFVHSQF